MKKGLFNRNFLLVVVGQIISLFGNQILRFALPLYLLDETGSSTVFGMVMACSFIPVVILSPIGGILADRVNKRNIMVVLDFCTAALTAAFLATRGVITPVLLIAVVMMILSGIQAVYQPSVQASMPFLQEPENLMAGNAIINQVNSLAGLLGPVIGGVVYGVWGLTPVVIVGGVCFLVSAIMEIFICMPFAKRKSKMGIFEVVKQDIHESLEYIQKEQPIIKKIVFLIALFNLFLTSMIIVGTPVLIKINLGLSSQLYGYTQGVLAFGGLAGGVMVGIFGKRMNIQNAWKILLLTSISILPMGMVLFLGAPAMVSYLVITICNGLLMVFATMFNVQMLVYVQTETPGHLIGKVISVIMAVATCAQPLGQAMYGVLFDRLQQTPHWILFGSTIIGVAIIVGSKKVFSEIEVDTETQGMSGEAVL